MMFSGLNPTTAVFTIPVSASGPVAASTFDPVVDAAAPTTCDAAVAGDDDERDEREVATTAPRHPLHSHTGRMRRDFG
jgi:hypothetical protein